MALSHRGTVRTAAIRTFLIADIRGYTRFTAQHGDEAASRLAIRFAEVATEGVEAWGGELVELRGDEALAVFDSARSALRAAAELQSAFADETRAAPDLPLGVGIGLDAGEAVPVGDGYRGAALNFAARLCAVAGPGEVLASEGLVHLAGRLEGLDYVPLEATSFKGYDSPVAATRVTATDGSPQVVDEDVAPSRQDASLPAELDPIVPLAGREAEVRWLSWHWRRARHGHGRTLVVSGAPGIGKTRLAAELATRAHASGAMVRYLPAHQGLDTMLDGHEVSGAPALVVVDDLDAAPPSRAPEVEQLARGVTGRSDAAHRDAPSRSATFDRRSWPNGWRRPSNAESSDRWSPMPFEPSPPSIPAEPRMSCRWRTWSRSRAVCRQPSTSWPASGLAPPPPSAWGRRLGGRARIVDGCAMPRPS